MSLENFRKIFTNELININQQQQSDSNQYSQNLNPNLYVNPYYMRPANRDALAPMTMLQQYRETGHVTPIPNTFTPYIPPQGQQVNIPNVFTNTPVNEGGK